MGIEYYIIKPSKKEKYYLGKHIYLTGFKNSSYFKDTVEADYPEYVDYDELAIEMIRVNGMMDYYVEQVYDIAYDIMEWCNDLVYIDNDCSNNFYTEYEGTAPKDYKETGSILNVFNQFKTKYQNLYFLEEQLDEVLDLIPEENLVTKDNIILAIPSIVNYLKEKKDDKR